MQISSVQSVSTSSILNQQNQLYSQIKSLKNKDAKANFSQIQQLQQQLNKILQPQVQPVVMKEPIKAQTNVKSPSTPADVSAGKNVNVKV